MLKVSTVGGLIEEFASAVNLTELAKGSTVWLAVTGLSRAGKTVFITSLIHICSARRIIRTACRC